MGLPRHFDGLVQNMIIDQRATVDATTVSDLWDRVTGTQPDPPLWIVGVAGAAALVAVVHGPTWRVARNVVTSPARV